MVSSRCANWKAMLFSAATLAAGVGSAAATSDLTCGFGPFRRRIGTTAFVVPTTSFCVEKRHSSSRAHHMLGLVTASPFAALSDGDNIIPDLSKNAADEHITDQPLLSELDAIRILRANPRRNTSDGDGNQEIPGKKDMKACHNAIDVLHLMSQASSSFHTAPTIDFTPSSLTNLSKEKLHSIVDPIVMDDISPNIAAAALRRLSSPPFLPTSSASSTGSKSSYHRYIHMNNKYKWLSQMNDAWTIEREVYDQLMQLLLKRLNVSIKNQLEVLSSSTTVDQHHDNHSPTLLPHRDSLMVPPTFNKVDESMMLNWYALADLLYSLSNLCNVLSNRNGRGNIIKGHLLTNISPQEQGSIMNLFDDVVRYISWDDKVTSSFVRCVGPKRLVRDVVQPLVVVVMARNKVQRRGMEGWVYSDTEEGVFEQASLSSSFNGNYNQLMAILSSYIVLPHSLEKLTASDLSMTLWTMTKIYHPLQLYNAFTPAAFGQPPTLLQLPQRTLLRVSMKRLRKYSVRSSTRGRDLVQAMWSVARLVSYLDEQDDQDLHQPKYNDPSGRALSLPIRLPGEEDESDFPLSFIPETTKVARSKDSTGVPTEALHQEAIIMFHTLLNDIVNPPYYSKNKSNSIIVNNKHEEVEEDIIKLHTLTLGQIADILEAATSLDISHDDIAMAVTKILNHLVSSNTSSSSQQSPLQQCRSCKDISRVLFSLQRLRVGSGIFDGVDNDNDSINEQNGTCNIGGLESRCVQLLGERFLDIVLWHKKQQQQSKWACDAKTLTIILRSGVMMFQGQGNSATEAMLEAASILILDHQSNNKGGEDDEGDNDEDGSSSSSFLSNEFEVSNFLFAFAVAKRLEEDVFIALTDQMTEDDILDSCTPSSASRAMWSAAMLLSLDGPAGSSQSGGTSFNKKNDFALRIGGDSFLHERLVDLFHQLSPLLLSSSLSPTDTSSAMWAMAKSQYVIDRGIFDQLALEMASDEMLKRSNTRLVSQALWSCGKMVEFEIQDDCDDEDADNESYADCMISSMPPYVQCVGKYLRFLIAHQAQMTPKHIAQSIWSIGRLRLSDSLLVHEMGDIASRRCDELNAREIANIVWGLSKVDDYDKPEIISKLVQHLTTSATLADECTAQEASNILFALGKLQIRDKKAFESLSSILKNRMNDATSHTIANALWAYEVVNIAPPAELLSTWASDRLGMSVPGNI